MANKLTNLKLGEVSLVGVPANPGARVMLFKRKDPKEVECAVCGKKGCTEHEQPAYKGVRFIIGIAKDGTTDVQSVAFDFALWTNALAKKWLTSHGLSTAKVAKSGGLRFVQKDAQLFERFRTIDASAQLAKVLRQQNAFSEIQRAVDMAIRAKFQPDMEGEDAYMHYCWIRDFFDGSVVFDQDGQCYRADYEIVRDEDGKITATIGERVPVEVVYQDVKKAQQQSFDAVLLRLANLKIERLKHSLQ